MPLAFFLRWLQTSLSFRELDLLMIGMMNDLFIESLNDEYKYDIIGTQEMVIAFYGCLINL